MKKMTQKHDNTKYMWPYLAEIGNYNLPYCCVMAYYYKYHYVVHLEKKAKFLEDTLKKIQTMEPTLDESVSKIKATEKLMK